MTELAMVESDDDFVDFVEENEEESENEKS